MAAERTGTRSIKVLHVLSSLAVRSGVLSVVENYHKYIDPADVSFDYVYFFELPDNRKEEVEARGSRAYFLPFQSSKRPLHAIEEFFAEHDGEWDIVHCHTPFAPQFFGVAAKRHGAARVVAHTHNTKYSDKPVSAVRNWALSKVVGLFATDYMTCSDAARVTLGRHGKEAFLLRNAIECDRFAFDLSARKEVRAELGVEDGCLVLGSVARLVAQKNQALMVETLAGLRGEGVSCKLVLAGTGDKDQALRDQAARLGVADDLLLLGNRSDAPRLYSAFDVYLNTSLFEGLCISLIEAQASGLPCLASDTTSPESRIRNIRYLSIRERASVWSEAALDAWKAGYDRVAGLQAAKDAHYDVRGEAGRLVKQYRWMLGATVPCGGDAS